MKVKPKAKKKDDAQLLAAGAIIDKAGQAIRQSYGRPLTLHEIAQLQRALQARLRPARKSGRKRQARITAAVRDYKAGLRGLPLYAKHIPGHEKLSELARTKFEHNLIDAVTKRIKHDKKRRSKPPPTG